MSKKKPIVPEVINTPDVRAAVAKILGEQVTPQLTGLDVIIRGLRVRAAKGNADAAKILLDLGLRTGTRPKMGRPLKWTSPDEFDKAVDEYFEQCQKAGKRPLWTGLALHLGFVSRDSLWDYGKKADFSDSVKKALSRIEASYEEAMMESKNQAGAIFALKNFQWKDKTETDLHVDGGIDFKEAQ